jgi:hypothetical protein
MLSSFIEGLNGPYSERLLKGTRDDVYTALETENMRLIALKRDDPELESWWSSERYHRARALQSEIDQIMKDKHEVMSRALPALLINHNPQPSALDLSP